MHRILFMPLPRDGGGDRRLLMAGLPDCLIGAEEREIYNDGRGKER